MKRSLKITATVLSLCALSAGLLGCRNENEMNEQIDTVKSAIENTRLLTSGEIMVYSTFKVQKETDLLQNSVTESYTKFINDGELQYDFTETTKITSTDDLYSFDANCDGGMTVVSRDGIVVDESEAPDIFAAFNIDYTVSDVESIETFDLTEQILYTMTMNEDYAAKSDYTEDDVEYDCTKVLYNYYVDLSGKVATLLSEHTYTATENGESQTVVVFSQTAVS